MNHSLWTRVIRVIRLYQVRNQLQRERIEPCFGHSSVSGGASVPGGHHGLLDEEELYMREESKRIARELEVILAEARHG